MAEIFEVGTPEEEIMGWYDLSKSLERRLEKEFDKVSDQVLTGQVDSYEGYKQKIGILQGLTIAKKHLKELKSK